MSYLSPPAAQRQTADVGRRNHWPLVQHGPEQRHQLIEIVFARRQPERCPQGADRGALEALAKTADRERPLQTGGSARRVDAKGMLRRSRIAEAAAANRDAPLACGSFDELSQSTSTSNGAALWAPARGGARRTTRRSAETIWRMRMSGLFRRQDDAARAWSTNLLQGRTGECSGRKSPRCEWQRQARWRGELAETRTKQVLDLRPP